MHHRPEKTQSRHPAARADTDAYNTKSPPERPGRTFCMRLCRPAYFTRTLVTLLPWRRMYRPGAAVSSSTRTPLRL